MSTKVALVTGASSGIGMDTALALRDKGYTVYAVARRVDRMADLKANGIHAFAMDVTDDESMVSGMKRIIDEAGRIDVLVNNAGYGSYGALEDVPLDEARRQFEVNVFGLARLTQLALPHMRAQRSGHIVNISSVGGKIYSPLGDWYHATKYAVEGLSNALRVELRPFGVHVVVIEPGAIRTEWSGIAAQSLLAMSGDTAYAAQAKALGAVMGAAETRTNLTSPPSVIAKAIVRAVTARRPRTRYVVGAGAKPIIFLHAVLPDRGFDVVTRLIVRFGARRATA
jgi:short-subunit dehydrogenase